MDTNGILNLGPYGFSGMGVFIVDCQFWDLESSTMRVTNKNDLLPMFEVGGVNLRGLHLGDGKDDLACLSRKSSGLQIHSIRVHRVCERLQQLLLDGGICKSHDLFELSTALVPNFL